MAARGWDWLGLVLRPTWPGCLPARHLSGCLDSTRTGASLRTEQQDHQFLSCLGGLLRAHCPAQSCSGTLLCPPPRTEGPGSPGVSLRCPWARCVGRVGHRGWAGSTGLSSCRADLQTRGVPKASPWSISQTSPTPGPNRVQVRVGPGFSVSVGVHPSSWRGLVLPSTPPRLCPSQTCHFSALLVTTTGQAQLLQPEPRGHHHSEFCIQGVFSPQRGTSGKCRAAWPRSCPVEQRLV